MQFSKCKHRIGIFIGEPLAKLIVNEPSSTVVIDRHILYSAIVLDCAQAHYKRAVTW